MTKPIDSHSPFVIQTSRAKESSPCPRFHSDRIASAGVSSQFQKIALRFFSNFKRNFPKVLLNIWNWIKYNVFFFFFDEKREKNLQIAHELRKFQEYYCSFVQNDEGKKSVFYHYDKLSEDARSLIEKQLKTIAQKKLSLSYEEVKEQIRENPFKALGKDKQAMTLLEACMDVRNDLTMGE